MDKWRSALATSIALACVLTASDWAIAQSMPVPPPMRDVSGSVAKSQPVWTQTPQIKDVLERYPQDARKAGIGGKAFARCIVQANGSLNACTILYETPKGKGFGGATIAVAKMFAVASKLTDGTTSRGASVIFPMRWEP